MVDNNGNRGRLVDMTTTNVLKSSREDMGRPKSPNPKGEQVAIRFNESTLAQLDKEIERELAAAPGGSLSRSEMIRRLIGEALASRNTRVSKRK